MQQVHQYFETILTKFWPQNCPKNWIVSIVKKMNIKTVVLHNPMPNYSLFGEFQIVGPNLEKRKNDKILN